MAKVIVTRRSNTPQWHLLYISNVQFARALDKLSLLAKVEQAPQQGASKAPFWPPSILPTIVD